MRPLDCVLDAIMNLIPENDLVHLDLCADLSRIKQSYRYADPEMIPHWWTEVADTLLFYLGVADNDWKREIAEVFADKKDFRKYLKAKDAHESET